jgi:D-galactarolactone cycloisomerase
VGVGSAYSHPGLVWLVVEKQLAPLLAGQDPTDVERLWETMYSVTRWYGRKGAAVSALGAVDVALWDLRGQALGQPVWKLLGGTQSRSPAYASALLWKEIPELANEAGQLVERGFRRVKMRLARGRDYDREAVAAVRRAIGPNCDLMCDGSMRYTVDEARELGRYLAGHRVFWFEEPFTPEDIDSYKALRGTIDVPLAAGENEFGLPGFRELLRAGALDIVQPDASRTGGITEVKRAADLAGTAGARVAPHTWSDAVAIVANAHVVASLAHGLTVEIDQTGNPFVEVLLGQPLSVVDGQIDLGNAPGLGIQVDRRVVERYRLKDPLDLPEGNYSDMVFGRKYWAG